MQGRSGPDRELFDAEAWARHLVPAGSVFAFLADHRRRLFPDEMFADLFPSSNGRPGLPADLVASTIVLQSLHSLSDADAVGALRFDLRWKVACGLPVDHGGFDASSLTYWRRRLARSERPERIFEVVRQVVAETGVLKGKTRRVLDSTVLMDAVATQDTVTQLIGAIRRVGRVVSGADTLIAACCTGHDYSKPGKPAITWDDPDARDALVSALVGDALALLAALAEQPDGSEQAAAVGLLALVAGQDVEPADGSDGTDGRWRIARAVARDRVISTVDPDARHVHKSRSVKIDGYKAHLIAEPDTGIITGCQLTRGGGEGAADGEAGQALLAADSTITSPAEILGDSAYGTADLLSAVVDAGHTPIIKPWPAPANIPGGFSPDAFTINHAAGTVTCPAGHTVPVRTGRTGRRTAAFTEHCADCPLRTRCTTANAGRTVTLHTHDKLLRAHRATATDPVFQATYRTHRPMIERTIAWLTRGNRRLRYHGTTKNNLWLHHRAAAVNLRRLVTLGLTHTDTGWALTATT
ncbi:IS1182 family transposase [Frankia sp. CNm7]|uniref:IS1182 family transposase n=1 Tax=Frankia nepalensis TaxID=1836974 RepID=A0A937RTK9_9ACTN|nr:IS1182 family transposase [Frankia nepalensis]MBL7502505.1 IS1182 family transposase [Frankia nepalensis]MBL7511697.1 IS1182 family transposase [Frankia nepalensis]MBL7523024.1 IS1182 family transposase [Frankia nepalensis]MBL7632543.1 IS1182 family transposase [Frankia nepalensis]